MHGQCMCGLCAALDQIDRWMEEEILNTDVEFVLICIGQDDYFEFNDNLDFPCNVKPKPE